MVGLTPKFEAICTECGSKMTVYNNYTTLCAGCKKHGDLGMFKHLSVSEIHTRLEQLRKEKLSKTE